jgi:sporulation protein YlmC with PRC-barrel domain
MTRQKIYETEDGVRIAPLGELKDFEVAKGYPDIRGWRVDAADGRKVGKVRELLVDVDTMRTRYLSIRLDSDLAASPTDRDALVPIGSAQISDGADVVRLPLTADRVALLPPYEHSQLSRAHEFEVRRHFSLADTTAGATPGAMGAGTTGAATGAAAGAAAAAGQRHFYDDEAYDDRRFFSSRQRANPDARPAADRTAAQRDIHLGEGEVRVPVERDESVVLKRGDDGRDEIIIRRPLGGTDARDR